MNANDINTVLAVLLVALIMAIIFAWNHPVVSRYVAANFEARAAGLEAGAKAQARVKAHSYLRHGLLKHGEGRTQSDARQLEARR